MKDISLEYAHIYTNQDYGREQEMSLKILNELKNDLRGNSLSLTVMVDDYSFPDPNFNYNTFIAWLTKNGQKPDVVIRESQLIPHCDEFLQEITDHKEKENVTQYIRDKKYPCSLFVATWYLIRLGAINSSLVPAEYQAAKLINILPNSFEPYEDKAFRLIELTKHAHLTSNIDNHYFDGRQVNFDAKNVETSGSGDSF